MPVPRLFYWPGNANLAPHVLLREIGERFELALVDRARSEQTSPEYRRLNPSGRIPALVDGDLVVFETLAICLHLVDTRPHVKLAPPVGTPERARFYAWLSYLATTLQTELVVHAYPERLGGAEASSVVLANSERRIGEMLDLLDAELARHGGPWMLGEAYSALDSYLAMLCRWTRKMPRPARERAQLGAFLRRIEQRPALRLAYEAEGLAQPWF